MSETPAKFKAQPADVLKKYLETKTVLIADSGASSRAGLFSIMKDLGAKPNNIHMVNHFEQAESFIIEKKPHVILADFDLGNRCGLDLFRSQKEQRPKEVKDCLFVIATGNGSQSAVARACEEDIDAFILKPFNVIQVRSILIKAAAQKLQPSEYHQVIEQAKSFIEKMNLDEAEALLKKAKSMDSSPTTACYYLGQVQYLRKVIDAAKGEYNQGLSFNKIHYRCLVGLYDLLMTQNDHRAAYEVVKKISQYFPANPKRLAEVLKLAIQTQQYEDIERYYALFTSLDQRDETLIRYVCAALIICSKHYISANIGHGRAIELLKKTAITAGNRTKILREIVLTLTDNGLGKDAEYFLSRFPPEYHLTDEFSVLSFLVSQTNPAHAPTPELGKKILLRGVIDDRLYKCMIEGYLRKNQLESAQDMAIDAGNKIPTKKAEFMALLPVAKK